MPYSDWADLCPQTIVWESNAGRDKFSKPTYVQAGTFQGRRSFKLTRMKAVERGTKGQGPEQISESQIWILDDPAITYEDRVYVQGDTDFPPILSVQRIPDETGDIFVKVYLGSSNG
jgi:hypothetical protein